ncbi:MAG: TerC/Alx family metal homeostasis membrane protein [Melioribacteraceae bacterium]
MDIHLLFWIGFVVIFSIVLIIDMFVTDHRSGAVGVKSALIWTAVWISTALIFGLLIYLFLPYGKTKSIEFITGYLIEYSLSVDNLFVFIMIFAAMKIVDRYQPVILKWGIIGAVVLRILFITAGVELLDKFSFMSYIFGAILLYTAFKILYSEDEESEPGKNIFVRMAKKIFPIDTEASNKHFFVFHKKKLYATVAFITLVMLESTDVIFALDSIPAVLSITQDPFIAITSNLFAILGLRSLFFALSGIIHLFRYLKYGISFILLFIGVKMLITAFIHISAAISLIVILVTLTVSVLLSILIKEKE